MRVLRIFVIMLAMIVAISGVSLYLISRGDDDVPVIVCSEEDMIVVSTNCTDGELLTYVTATDEQDGDLSNKIIVTRKMFFIAPKTTLVTFSVSDSDNNVTSIEKKVYFEDYVSPRLILTNDFIFPSGNHYNLNPYVTATDVFDGDIGSKIKIIATGYSTSEGTFKATIKVSNSMADSTEITIDAIVTDDNYGLYRVRLNDYIHYTTVGSEPFDYVANLKSVINKDTNKTFYSVDDVVVDSSEVDMSKPGCYNVYYRILSDELDFNDQPKVISMSRLVVVVEEGKQ